MVLKDFLVSNKINLPGWNCHWNLGRASLYENDF